MVVNEDEEEGDVIRIRLDSYQQDWLNRDDGTGVVVERVTSLEPVLNNLPQWLYFLFIVVVIEFQ